MTIPHGDRSAHGLARIDESTPAKAILITRIRVIRLFGLYTYDLPKAGTDLGRTPILYGENGLGKTNLLRILFHLLSPADNRSHRTALSQIKFQSVEVQLSTKIVVSAQRLGDSLEGPLRFEIAREAPQGRELLGAWDYDPNARKGEHTQQQMWAQLDPAVVQRITSQSATRHRDTAIQRLLFDSIAKQVDPRESEVAFLKALREFVPPIYFLSADRALTSDHVEREKADPAEQRSIYVDAMVTEGRERALRRAIELASRHLSQLGFRAAQQGSRSMHSIYFDLIKRLASRSAAPKKKQPQSLAELKTSLIELSDKYSMFERYRLAPQFQGPAIVTMLDEIGARERSVAAIVLRPYVESLTLQATRFAPVYAAIDTLVSVVNAFLFEKTLEFKVGDSITVSNRSGEKLSSRDLSSGEQQLLLLFCHILIATNSGGIFIVDEPEISLNVKWQRRLLDALQRLDLANTLQFVLASHSIEILTRHRDSVVTLAEVGV